MANKIEQPLGANPSTRRAVVPLQQPCRLGQAKSAQPRLGQQIDDLYQLRSLIKQSQAAEKAVEAGRG